MPIELSSENVKKTKSSKNKIKEIPKKSYKIVVRKLPITNYDSLNFQEDTSRFIQYFGTQNISFRFEHFIQGKLSRQRGPVAGVGFFSVNDENLAHKILSHSSSQHPFLQGDVGNPDIVLAPYQKVFRIKEKPDKLMGTYQTDPDYLAFVAREETPATKKNITESNQDLKASISNDPSQSALLKFIREKTEKKKTIKSRNKSDKKGVTGDSNKKGDGKKSRESKKDKNKISSGNQPIRILVKSSSSTTSKSSDITETSNESISSDIKTKKLQMHSTENDINKDQSIKPQQQQLLLLLQNNTKRNSGRGLYTNNRSIKSNENIHHVAVVVNQESEEIKKLAQDSIKAFRERSSGGVNNEGKKETNQTSKQDNHNKSENHNNSQVRNHNRHSIERKDDSVINSDNNLNLEIKMNTKHEDHRRSTSGRNEERGRRGGRGRGRREEQEETNQIRLKIRESDDKTI